MSDPSDQVIADARAAYQRITGRDDPADYAVRRRRAGKGKLGQRIARIAIADAAILVAAVVVGMVWPLGLFGALAVMALLIATTIALAIFPGEAPPPPERLREANLKALPDQTARWLDTQRPMLPPPARSLADQIGIRLETLRTQVAALDESAPVAAEVRKLVGEQLPDFIRDYQKVPANLRGVARNGQTPDGQLVEGLGVIDREIAQVSEQLAQGDLDGLATRARFLEIKYKGDDPA